VINAITSFVGNFSPVQGGFPTAHQLVVVSSMETTELRLKMTAAPL
jgi:hypothetical protein